MAHKGCWQREVCWAPLGNTGRPQFKPKPRACSSVIACLSRTQALGSLQRDAKTLAPLYRAQGQSGKMGRADCDTVLTQQSHDMWHVCHKHQPASSKVIRRQKRGRETGRRQNQGFSSRAWWHTPLIPELGRQRQAISWVQGKPVRLLLTQRNSVLKKQTKQKQTMCTTMPHPNMV